MAMRGGTALTAMEAGSGPRAGGLAERPDFARILSFLTDAETAGLEARQHALLKRIVAACSTGFTLRELPLVSDLVDCVHARIAAGANADCEPTLCKIVRLCGKLGLREKSNEELLSPGLAAAEGMLRTLRKLLCSESPRIAIEAARALRSVAAGDGESVSAYATNPGASRELTRSLLLKADVVAGAVAELAARLAVLVAEDDDGTADRLGAAVKAAVDADSSDEEEGASRASSRRGVAHSERSLKRGPPSVQKPAPAPPGRGAKRTASMRGPLVFSTAPRTVEYAQGQMVLALVKLLRELSAWGAAAAALVRCGGMAACIDVLRCYLHEPLTSEAVAVTVEVIWNALEHSALEVTATSSVAPAASRGALLARRRDHNAMWHLSADAPLAVLRQLLSQLFCKGRRAADKQLRNEVLIVASHIASHSKSHAHFRTMELLQLVLAYAVASEQAPDAHGKAAYDESASPASFGACGSDAAATGLLDGGPLADRHNFATSSDEDLEMKRIVWTLLSDLGRRDQANLEFIVEADFMGALLMYLDVGLEDSETVEPPTRRPPQEDDDGPPTPGTIASANTDEASLAPFPEPPAVRPARPPPPAPRTPRVVPSVLRRLPLTQVHVLQQQAMAVLLNLAPRAPAAFQALRGHIVALRFLDACDPSTDTDADDATLGDLSNAPPKPRAEAPPGNLIQGALMLLISVVGLPGLQEELGALDAVRIMLRRFNDVSAAAALRTDAVQILSKLCENHAENQARLRRLGGVTALVCEVEKFCLGREPAPRAKPALDAGDVQAVPSSPSEKVSPLIVGVLDCLWNGVVGNRRSEARLPPAHGIDALLSLLEVGPVLMRHQVCGLVADLARNGKLVPYVREWRSDRSMRSAAQVFAHAWEDEELRLGADRHRGVLDNLAQPLRRQSRGRLTRDDDHAVKADDDVSDDDASEDFALKALALQTRRALTQRDFGTKFARKSHGGSLQQSASAKADRAIRQAVGACDLRAKIGPVLAAMGHESAAAGIPAEDRATLCMVEHYEAFVDGEAWTAVRDSLGEAGVKPIAADAKLLDIKLGAVLSTASKAQATQKFLAGERELEEQHTEDAYLGTILLQRDQEIRQLAIKRNAMVPKSLQNKRRAEREAKMKLLALENAPVLDGPAAEPPSAAA
ncbi:hypothetical protein M885DRAFT_586352 [Pelagophyceae sp. CCMP2097]|nr:hypothetical protein M885DRAFT_586352 [Pelagophyceae sp. CCMP2097]